MSKSYDSTERKIDVTRDFTEEEEAVFLPKSKRNTSDTPSAIEESMADTVARLYTSAVPVKAITSQLGITYGRMYKMLEAKGIPKRTGQLPPITDSEKRYVVEDYLNGMKMEDMFEKYHANKGMIYKVLDEYDIPRRSDGTSSVLTPTELYTGNKQIITADSEPVKTNEGIRVDGDLYIDDDGILHVNIYKQPDVDIRYIDIGITLEDN